MLDVVTLLRLVCKPILVLRSPSPLYVQAQPSFHSAVYSLLTKLGAEITGYPEALIEARITYELNMTFAGSEGPAYSVQIVSTLRVRVSTSGLIRLTPLMSCVLG